MYLLLSYVFIFKVSILQTTYIHQGTQGTGQEGKNISSSLVPEGKATYLLSFNSQAATQGQMAGAATPESLEDSVFSQRQLFSSLKI